MVRRPGHDVDGRFGTDYQGQSGGECESGPGSVVKASDQPQQPASHVSNNELLRNCALSHDKATNAIDHQKLSWGASLLASDYRTAKGIQANRAPTPPGSDYIRDHQSGSNGAGYTAPPLPPLHDQAAKHGVDYRRADGVDYHRAFPAPATDYSAAGGGEQYRLSTNAKFPRAQPGDGVQHTTLQRPAEILEPNMEPADRQIPGIEPGIIEPGIDGPYTPAETATDEAQHPETPQAPSPNPQGVGRPFISPFANVVGSLRNVLPARPAAGRGGGTRGNKQRIPPGDSKGIDQRDSQGPGGGFGDDPAAGLVPRGDSGSSPHSQSSLGSALTFESGALAEAANCSTDSLLNPFGRSAERNLNPC